MDKKTLVKYISAFAMGDGGFYRIYNGNGYRFIGGHIIKNRDYVNFKVSVLKNLTNTRVTTVNYPVGYNRQEFLRIETNTHPLYKAMWERLYTGTYKGLDPHYLKLLDWEMLAILFMDDGNSRNRKKVNRQPEITLGTCRLTYGDQILLKHTIEKRLGIYFNINRHGNQYVLRLRNKDGPAFMEGVKPYILPSFSYKWICPDEWLLRNKDDDIV